MATVEKVLVRRGVYSAPTRGPDGQVKPGRLEVTPARIRHWTKSFAAMKRQGIQIPVCWGHQPGAIPGDGKDRATRQFMLSKLNAGYLKDMAVARDGVLKGRLDVPGAEEDGDGNLITWTELPDGRKVKSAIREVSVAIRDWTDGTGKKWDDCIVHVALVTLPVMAGQEEGFAPSRGEVGGPGEWHLSLSDLLFTMATVDEPKRTNMPDLNMPGGAGGASGDSMTETIRILRRFGLPLRADTDEGNLAERINLLGGALIDLGHAPESDEAEDMIDEAEDALGDELGEEGFDEDVEGDEFGDEFGDEELGDEELGDLDGDEEQEMAEELPDEDGDDEMDVGDGELDEEGMGDEEGGGSLLDSLTGRGGSDEGDDLSDDDEEAVGMDDDDGEEDVDISGDSDAMPGDSDDEDDAQEEPRPVMMSTGRGKKSATLRTPMEKALGLNLARGIQGGRLKKVAALERKGLPKHQADALRKKIAKSPVRLARRGDEVAPVRDAVDIELSTIEGLFASGTAGGGVISNARRAKRPDGGNGENDREMKRLIEEGAASVSVNRGKKTRKRK